MKKNVNEKKIPFKNYIYAVLILVFSILIVLYIFSWYNVKKEEKLMNSYLITSKTIESKIKDLNTLEQVISEAPLSYFVLVSFTGNEEVYNLEKSIKRYIDKYKLNDSFYYVDASNNKNNSEYLNKLNKIFNTNKINNIPVLIYIDEGNVKEIINDLKIESFKDLLVQYKFETVK